VESPAHPSGFDCRPKDISADERDYILLSRHSRRRVRLKQAAIGALAVLAVLAAILALTA
jgi:hypothetical protein